MSKRYEIECAEDWINDTHRYRLDVAIERRTNRRLVVVQINPSMAGKRNDDGTIRSDSTVGKVTAWADENGFGRITFLNLFAYIATDQGLLGSIPFKTLVGKRNDQFITSSIGDADKVVVAWGRPHKNLDQAVFDRRVADLKSLLGRKRIYAVGEPVALRFPRHGRLWNTGNRFLRPFNWPKT